MADVPRFVPRDVVDDRYRIVALLGRGGMGDLYRTDDSDSLLGEVERMPLREICRATYREATMTNPEMTLVSTSLEVAARVLAGDAANASAWADVRAALEHHGVGPGADAELDAAIEGQDAETLTRIVSEWASGDRLMLEHDRGVLKRALKAYRKRLKVTLLEAESSLGGGPMSAGRASSIVGIVPPERYPREVWDELVRQKRLVAGDRGTYELAPGM